MLRLRGWWGGVGALPSPEVLRTGLARAGGCAGAGLSPQTRSASFVLQAIHEVPGVDVNPNPRVLPDEDGDSSALHSHGMCF